MILAAGLTPAWQEIYVFDHVAPGEVNRAAAVERCASGKVINVGVALTLLQCENRVLSVNGGLAGAALDADLANLGVDRRWVNVATPTRTCVTMLDRESNQATELVENAGSLTASELASFRDAFADEASAAEFVVLTGSLPTGVPTSFYRQLLDRVGCSVLLDVRGPELLAALNARPLVVKPNREELAATLGRSLETDDGLLHAMAELNNRGATWVVVSEGKQAVWLRGPGGTFRLQPPHLECVTNPIGCGDVLAAGIAASLVRGAEPREAVRFGIAAAAHSATELLPARFDATKTTAMAATIEVSRVN
ncbi:MAG TPA: PfkB family carbohydrate kinase [Pirellulales bacterium]|nr:PfkB family carbohydrate kinase [Pirellulales bacterium]